MSYTDGLLATGERIVKREHQHPFVLIWDSRGGILALVLALAIVIINIATGPHGTDGFFTVLGYLTLILVVVGLALVAWSYLKYRNEEFVVTNRRIIHARGVINKEASDSALEKINDANLKESLFGRMFGFGDLDVDTASEAGIERLRMLRDPKDYKIAMLNAKRELEIDVSRAAYPVPAQAPAPAYAPAPPPAAPVNDHMSSDEVASAVDRLGELRDKGLITPEEFEAKKKELLERL
jgi:uncharacterized membrane protein YdbT with pleckstrin-like domain